MNLVRKLQDSARKLMRRRANSRMSAGMASAETMLRMVAQTRDVEIACEEAHRLLDQFADMVARGEDAAALMPLVQQHLEMCPDCREEYEALMRILRAPQEPV